MVESVLVNEEVTVETSEEMRDLGRQLGGLPRAGDVIILGAPNREGSSVEGDQPRTVRMRGLGERWQDTRLTRADVINRL
jgi:hypothetical protein